MTKFCPQCYRTYDDPDLDTCPEDAARLFHRTEKPDDPLVGTVLDRRFRIEKPLSEGGMGAVYRATQLSVHREVALKVVRPDLDADDLFMERFFREARVVAELSHPNIVRLIDFGHDGERDILYLVMELVRGTEMGHLLTRGRLEPTLAMDVAYQVCAGLTEPHSQGVVHRDLKPANIILVPSSDGTFQVKILDFGIARTAEAGTRLTATGMICGTPAYLSPEQAQNIEVDERTDLYSLGVVLFEMLTGHLPFRGPSGLQLLLKHVQRPAPRLATAYPKIIPASLSQLVSDLMEKDPANRPQTAMEVRRRIHKIRGELGMAPVFLDDHRVEPDDTEELFLPWLATELDPDKLDDIDGQSGPRPTPDLDLLETLVASSDASDKKAPPEDSDLALQETLGADSETHRGSDVSEDSDLALLETLAADSETTEDSDLALQETLASDSPDDESEETADTDEVADTDEAVDTEEIEDSPEKISTDPPTAPAIRERGPRRALRATLVVAGTITTVGLLVALATSLFSDHSSLPEDDSASSALADEVIDEHQKPVAKIEDRLAPEAEDLELPEQLQDTEKEEPDSPPSESEQEMAPEPVVEPPEPPAEPSPSETSPVEVAEATADSPQQEPGAGQPPPAPADPAEGDSSEEIHEGSIVLESPSEVEPAAEYTRITGNLVVRINIDGFSQLELPKLEQLGGNLVIEPLSQVSTISLPRLKQVGGGLILTQGEYLETLDAPQLRSIGQNLMMNSTTMEALKLESLQQVGAMVHFSQNQKLSTIELPHLQDVGGAFSVMQNPHLQSLKMPRLRDVAEEFQILSGALETIRLDRLHTVGGGVIFHENKSLRSLHMGNLTTVGMSSTNQTGVTFNNASSLETLDLSELRRVNGNIVMSSMPRLRQLNFSSLQHVGEQLTLSENHAVEVIDLSNLTNVGTNLLITGHPSLRELILPHLQNVDDLLVMNNPNLSSCALRSLAEELEADGWDGEARLLNLDDEDCS